MQNSSLPSTIESGQTLMIFIENLPGTASWQSLKDLLRHAGIDVEYAEFDKKSFSAIVRLNGEDNFTRAFNFLQNERWMGRRMRPWVVPVYSAPLSNYQPVSQYRQLQYTYNVRRTHPPVDRAQANTALLSNTFYPSVALQDQVVYYNPAPPSQTYLGHRVPILTGPPNVPTLDYNLPPSPERDAHEPVLGPFVQTEACGIHIKNLPNGITECKIRGLVAQILGVSDDKITAVELPMRDGVPKGYAIVALQDRKLVGLAIEALNGLDYNGQKLKVKQDQDRKTLRDVQPRHPTIDGHNVPSIAVGSFRGSISQPTVRIKAQEASNSPNTVMGIRGSSRQSARRSTSCTRDLSDSSHTHAVTDIEQLPRRLSDLCLTSPPVVNGSMSRLIGSTSTNRKDDKKFRKPGSGSTSKPGGGHVHTRKDHNDSPPARCGGSDNLKGSKKRH